MKVGVIGVGFVGTSCAKAMLLRGSCDEIVMIDVAENEARTEGTAYDLSHGAPLCGGTRLIPTLDYGLLGDADVVVVTAGKKEADLASGKAVDTRDVKGRLHLLGDNADTYEAVIPDVAGVAPDVPIIVVTDPPDPLADVAREFTKTNPIISTGTFLDSLRFRVQLGELLGCNANDIDAIVIGEHGTSQVYVWSSAQAGGEPVLDRARDVWEARGRAFDPIAFRSLVEKNVRFANIKIIKGTGASQHGIGIVTARIVEAMLGKARLREPVAVCHTDFDSDFDVTLSLPSIIDGDRIEVLKPAISPDESTALKASAAAIRDAFNDWQSKRR